MDAPSGAPQLVQNNSPSFISAPHLVQTAAFRSVIAAGVTGAAGTSGTAGSELSFAPHSVQNCDPSLMTAPQFGQFIIQISFFLHHVHA
jgi:hypothetical protein